MFYSHVSGCRYLNGCLYPGLADRMAHEGAGNAFSSPQEMEECRPSDYPHGLIELIEEENGYTWARVWNDDPVDYGWYNTYSVLDYYMFDNDFCEERTLIR